MDVFVTIMSVVFGVLVFATLMAKLLAPKIPVAEEDTAAPRRTEPTPTDVNRFLAEVNRRRREAERQPPDAFLPLPEGRRESRRERRSERPVPAVRRVPEEQARRLPTVQLVEAIAAPNEPEPARRVPTGNEGRGAGQISPVLSAALPLLRSPRALGTAIVLQEIFGPPVCRRRR